MKVLPLPKYILTSALHISAVRLLNIIPKFAVMKLFRILLLVIIGCSAVLRPTTLAWNDQMDQMYQCHADAA